MAWDILAMIGSGNSLSHMRNQAINGTNGHLSSIRHKLPWNPHSRKRIWKYRVEILAISDRVHVYNIA